MLQLFNKNEKLKERRKIKMETYYMFRISKVNEENERSVLIKVPTKEKEKIEKLLKSLKTKRSDKFNISLCQNKANIRLNLSDYFKDELTIKDIIKGIRALERDIEIILYIDEEKLIDVIENNAVITKEVLLSLNYNVDLLYNILKDKSDKIDNIINLARFQLDYEEQKLIKEKLNTKEIQKEEILRQEIESLGCDNIRNE